MTDDCLPANPSVSEVLDRPGEDDSLIPSIVSAAGAGARFAWEEFFHARIRNPHTRTAYSYAVRRFLRSIEPMGVQLHRIAPAQVGRYIDGLSYSPATKQLHLAALRKFFDELVIRHVILLNPAASVRGERLQVMEGRTPAMAVRDARRLLNSIDDSHVVGLRDRAVIAILIYTAVRAGAVARLRLRDFYDVGDQHCLRFAEKGGKSREIPVRHDLQRLLERYLETAGFAAEPDHAAFFRTALRRTKSLTMNPMTPNDIGRMVKRRLRDAGLPLRFSPHSFRVTVITDLLEQGVSLSDVQNLAGHADPRTTRLYDRRHRQVTRNLVERISV